MSNNEAEEEQELAILEELETIQAQISSYQGLLKDLPEIYERKFHERLQPFLDRQHQLLQERELLLTQLHQQLPEGTRGQTMGTLPPSALPGPPPLTNSRRWFDRRFWRWVGLAVLGGLIGVQLSQHLGKRSGATSMGSRGGMEDPPCWERQTTRGPATAPPTQATPEKAPV